MHELEGTLSALMERVLRERPARPLAALSEALLEADAKVRRAAKSGIAC